MTQKILEHPKFAQMYGAVIPADTKSQLLLYGPLIYLEWELHSKKKILKFLKCQISCSSFTETFSESTHVLIQVYSQRPISQFSISSTFGNGYHSCQLSVLFFLTLHLYSSLPHLSASLFSSEMSFFVDFFLILRTNQRVTLKSIIP